MELHTCQDAWLPVVPAFAGAVRAAACPVAAPFSGGCVFACLCPVPGVDAGLVQVHPAHSGHPGLSGRRSQSAHRGPSSAHRNQPGHTVHPANDACFSVMTSADPSITTFAGLSASTTVSAVVATSVALATAGCLTHGRSGRLLCDRLSARPVCDPLSARPAGDSRGRFARRPTFAPRLAGLAPVHPASTRQRRAA